MTRLMQVSVRVGRNPESVMVESQHSRSLPHSPRRPAKDAFKMDMIMNNDLRYYNSIFI